MQFIVEDGTGLYNATSLISLEEAREYDLDNVLPEDDDLAEALLIRASFYFTFLETKLCGRRKEAYQALAFPRVVKSCCGCELEEMPSNLPFAILQISATLSNSSYSDLFPSVTPSDVKREEVGPLKVEYKDSSISANNSAVVITSLKQLLSAYFCDSKSINMRVFRA